MRTLIAVLVCILTLVALAGLLSFRRTESAEGFADAAGVVPRVTIDDPVRGVGPAAWWTLAPTTGHDGRRWLYAGTADGLGGVATGAVHTAGETRTGSLVTLRGVRVLGAADDTALVEKAAGGADPSRRWGIGTSSAGVRVYSAPHGGIKLGFAQPDGSFVDAVTVDGASKDVKIRGGRLLLCDPAGNNCAQVTST